MSKSIWDDPRITAYVLGGLSDDERAEFEQQLESDAGLAAAVAEARSITGQLQTFYDSESTPRLSVEHRNAIMSGEQTSDDVAVLTTAVDRAKLPKGLWVTVFAAAAVLLLLVVPPWLMDRGEVAMDQGPLAPNRDVEVESLVENDRGKARMGGDLSVVEGMENSATEGLELDNLDEMADNASVDDSGIGQDAEPFGSPVEVIKDQSSTADNSVARPQMLRQSRSSSESKAKDVEEAPGMPDGKAPGVARALGGRRSQGNALSEPAPAEFQPKVARGVSEPKAESRVADAPDGVAVAESAAIAVPRPDAIAAPSMPTRSMDSKKGDNSLSQGMPVPAPVAPGSAAPAMGNEPAAPTAPASQSTASRGAKLRKRAEAEKPRNLGRMLGGGRGGGAAEDDDDEGRGAGFGGDQFEKITDNPFVRTSEEPLSTFSVDVDTASYSKTRDYLLRVGKLPRPDAVRIEELVNYFDYKYSVPDAGEELPFSVDVVTTECPWNRDHQLARIALKGKTFKKASRPACNLVFLLDTSGSMNRPNKLPLVIEGMKMLVGQLRKEDRVAITVYAGSAGLVLDSVSAKRDEEIRRALTDLSAGGSTNGGQGIQLAYQTARDHFIADGVNRVILCTDGDFNVGLTGTDALVRLVEKEAKGGIFLSVLGFGMGNHNDQMLEKISGRGNGNYAFIDTINEAKKVLVDQTAGTLVTIAKDVKLQVEFNIKKVAQYRLLGYENRVLANQDFANDKKDAGEIGAGHAVTAFYEIVPVGKNADGIGPPVGESRYQKDREPSDAADGSELMFLKLRYKEPDKSKSQEVDFPIEGDVIAFEKADQDVRFAASVAGFGMQLRQSPYRGSWTLADVLKTAKGSVGKDTYGLRAEFIEMVQKASELVAGE